MALSYREAAVVLGKALAFLFGALALGAAMSPRLFSFAARLRGHGRLLATALVFCFTLAYAASAVGLAPIVGAYAAGLVLEETHYTEFADRDEPALEELVRPIGTLLVPVFFVLMGMRVELQAFAQPEVLAGLLTLAAIAVEQACALGGLGAGVDRLSIGLGMIPRGEVGLIFANLGLGLTVHGERVVDPTTFSAVVIVVVLTTLVTPPALKWSLARAEPRSSPIETADRHRERELQLGREDSNLQLLG